MAALQRVLMDLHDIQVAVPFNLSGEQNVHQPTQVLADIGASGFNLPDRDYYLKPDARFKEAREKYVEHIAKMFTLAGWDAQVRGRSGADRHGDGNEVRGSIARPRRVARSRRDRPQYDVRAITGDGAAL